MPPDGTAARSALVKGLVVLETLVDAGGPLTLSRLVSRCELPKSTTYRVAVALVERGWLRETPEGYWLGYRFLQSIGVLEGTLDARHEAAEAMRALRDELDETVHLAVLDHEYRVVYLEKLVPASQAVGLMQSRVGATAPAYCTGIGKAMLAHLSREELDRFFATARLVPFTNRTIVSRVELETELERIRLRGYSTDIREHENSVSCVAAAVFDRNGRPIAGLSVAGPYERMQVLLEDEAVGRRVHELALSVSERFGWRNAVSPNRTA